MYKRLSVCSLLLFACFAKKIREWRFIQVISESLSDYRKSNILPVSISIITPRWFGGRTYVELAPRRGMLGLSSDEYRKEFSKILKMNSPMKVYKDLEIMVRNDRKVAIALLCYESPEKFCHRHLVAEWFMEKLGIEVREFDYVPKIEAPVPEQLNLFINEYEEG